MRICLIRQLCAVAAITLAGALSAGAAQGASNGIFFETSILPLFDRHCVECHNPKARKANLDLTTAEGVVRGGDSGVIFKAGDPKGSSLYQLVHHGEMPREKPRLADAEIERIGRWIKSGAQFKQPPVIADEPPHQHDVTPILLLRCTVCHGPRRKDGGLDLRTKAAMLKGGKSGPAMVPGDPDGSLMIRRIESGECPPLHLLLKYFVRKPTSEEVKTLREWIAAGAPEKDIRPDVATGSMDVLVTDEDREHWAFQPPKTIAPPTGGEGASGNPVDAFIGRRLKEKGFSFSREADRRTLIRRAWVDLTGLPPSVGELDRWMGSQGERWFEEMVDHLLASPRYGERWGRYWLDLAGYASSEGGISADTIRQVEWKYRDYVIRAFNNDKPYDRFLLEQIAGDELADYTDPEGVTPEIVDNLIATGFLRMGIDQTGSRTMNFVPERLGVIADAINVVGSGVMGLTLECARCHGHKYDPIPLRDYYRLKAVFQGAFDEHDWLSWKNRKLTLATPGERKRYSAAAGTIGKEIKSLESKRRRAVSSLQTKYFKERRPTLSDELYDEFKAAQKVTQGRLTLRQEELLAKYETFLKPTEAQLREMHPELAKELDETDSRLKELRGEMPPPLTVRAVWDRGEPSPTYILKRGEHNRPGRLVGPGVLSALTDGRTPFDYSPPWKGAPSTGRRLAFAKWLTNPDHPLTTRVFVNRVWKEHFGIGLVKTLENFGRQGERPSHPELLDWLAKEFVSSGWSVKELHRRLMNSRTYRQASEVDPEIDRIDPENRLLSRMSMRRLNAEALRDSLLFVSGRLDDRMFGASDPVSVREDGLIMADASENGWRRSVYLRYRRTELPSLLDTFDYPEMGPNCVQRSVSTVSLQALMLSNNRRVYELAGSFAERLQAEAGGNVEAMVKRAYKSALSREPGEDELTKAEKSVAAIAAEFRKAGESETFALTQATTAFCHALLNSAEFVYVD